MDRKAVFNEIINDYAMARPGYPIELYNDIVEFSAIEPNAKILEIGSGPGQATDYFIKKGYKTTGLEIGAKQVQFLAEKYCVYPNFNPVLSTFEEYDCPDETYDLVFSATAFHWIAPEIGYPKAYHLLKKNGTLAVFWHMCSIIRQHTDAFIEISRIYQKYAPQLDDFISEDEADAMHNLRISQIQTNGLFGCPTFKSYKWMDEYTTERYITLLKTYSDLYEVDSRKRSLVLDAIAEYIDSTNGKIVLPQEVWLYMVVK